MPSSLDRDLKQLKRMAFDRSTLCEASLQRYHSVARETGHRSLEQIDILHRWMLTPISLWPVNIHHLFDFCVGELASGQSLDEQVNLILQTLPSPPSSKVCDLVIQQEHDVQSGRYEALINSKVKFDSTEKAAHRNNELQQEWNWIKRCWNISPRRKSQIFRRTLSQERNLREPFSVNCKVAKDRFQAALDVFCFKWNLYGMRGDEPLPMKLSVNLTPHGTMIFIPAYWSFDPKRDIRWPEVTRLHRARAKKRQGTILAEGAEARRQKFLLLQKLDKKAKALGIRGLKLHEFLCAGLGWVPDTSPRRIARLRAEFGR